MAAGRSGRAALILAGLAALLVATGAVVLLVAQGRCTDVPLWSSDEKYAELQELAKRYRESDREIDGRCVSVNVSIHGSRATSDELAEAAAAPWGADDQPVVWTPSSSIWIERLRAAVKERPGLRVRGVSTAPSLATSPVVIAMPRPMAEALGWPNTPVGWRDILSLARDPRGWGARGHPEWGRFKLGKTNPEESTTGLLSTISTAAALVGGGEALTPQALPKIAGDMRALEQAAIHYGRYVETFIGNLYQADQEGTALAYISAIALEEKVVLDYNRGIILDNPPRRDAPPRQKLAAIFPSDGTIVSDNPALIVDAAWVTDTQRAAATDFIQYIQENNQVLLDAGFRGGEGDPGQIHRPENGTLTRPEYRLVRTPDIRTTEAVRQLWAQNRRRANVLLVIDVSGSMSKPVGDTGRTRLELAKGAAGLIPQRLAADDRIALWEFSSEVGRDDARPWRDLVRLGPVAATAADFGGKIGALQPIGGTALYATVRAAVGATGDRYDPTRINAVILLSDGRNEYPADDDLGRLVDDLRQAGPDRTVPVFTIAYGEEADAKTLTDISRASRGSSYNATDAVSINDIMLDVLSNF